MHKFTTLVHHIGDRPHEPYTVGETREVDDSNTVQHLVDGCVLGEHDSKVESAWKKAQAEKAEKGADANKAEAGADENKAAK